MPPRAAKAGGAAKPRRKRARKTRTAAVDSASSSSSSDSESSSASEQEAVPVPSKAAARSAVEAESDSDSSSSSTSSSSSSSTGGRIVASTSGERGAKAKTSTSSRSATRTARPHQYSPEPASSDDGFSSDEEGAAHHAVPDPLQRLPAPSRPAASSASRRGHESVKLNSDSTANANGVTPARPEKTPAEKADEARRLAAAKQVAFRGYWMQAIAEGFGDELDAMRQREPALGGGSSSDGGSRLPLLIDALATGAEIFCRSSTIAAGGGGANSSTGAQTGPGAQDGGDEIDMVLNTEGIRV